MASQWDLDVATECIHRRTACYCDDFGFMV
jgi:hypothetical protein